MPTHPTDAVGVPLLLLRYGNLVANLEVSEIGVGLDEALRSELRINRLFDLLGEKLIGNFNPRDINPLVGLEFGEIGALRKIVTDVLRQSCTICNQNDSYHDNELNQAVISF
jgi:hypothetical protein